MDPSRSAQDVIRCDLCETAIVQMYCDFCHVNLCKPCIGEHIADDYNKHQIVQIQQRKSTLIYPQCKTHETKRSEFQCEECNTSVCSLCIITDTHKEHTITTLLDIFNSKREVIRKDTEELEQILSPTYEEIATDIEAQLANLDGEYAKLSTAVTKHGEEWHEEIDNIVNKLTTEIEDVKNKHRSILKKHLDEIKQIIYQIEQTLLQLNRIDESNEVSMTMEYSSKIEELSKLPPKVKISLPVFSPKAKDTEHLYTLFGSLTELTTKTEENGYKLKKPETPTIELLEEPELITTINTGYGNLCSVACLSEEEIWTSGFVNDMKCFNIQSSLIKTIKTKSGVWPGDIAVTGDGDLVYSDWKTKIVNKVKNEQTEEVIRLQDWRPSNLCVTSSGDLLVNMHSDDKTKSKVVRYSGSTEKQTIQFDEEGKPLYSGNAKIKYISENRNLDICVADFRAGAVVVVNQAGKLRFRYTGHPSATKNKPFEPCGITTDSQSQILTADYHNHCIHILDQDGQFIRYIDNCDLKGPFGLCVDKSDTLFVAEWSGKLKKIKYLR
ncbi:tripartite motif-containing protein 3-like [Saccostrea cucullata]|uniref:tripartite motif-containing protein 3-like n=1 Tax=Saccostrea cuccullata TaxID=36930 RepID=UPI002ED4BA83